MTDKRKLSRLAGLLYLVVVITGMFSLAYVPKQLLVEGDPAVTFRNISTREILFRASLLSSVICYISFIFLPLVLHRLLQSVNTAHANAMAILAIGSAPISFINLQNKYAILSLVGEQDLSAQQQVMEYLTQYDQGIFMATLFWGLWLLPFGYLVYTSSFLPRFLGVLLVLGGIGYVINFTGNTLSGFYKNIGISKYLRMLPAIGEIGTCLWLLIIGAREKKQS